MTGRDEPSQEELQRHLERRVEGLEERYNRHGMPIPLKNNNQKSTGGHALISHNNRLSGGTSSSNRNGQKGNSEPAKSATKSGKGAGAGSTA